MQAVGRAYMFKDTATANALGYTASNIFLETPRKAYGLRLATLRQEQSMPPIAGGSLRLAEAREWAIRINSAVKRGEQCRVPINHLETITEQ